MARTSPLAWLAWLTTVASIAACGGRYADPATAAHDGATRATNDWATRFIGTPPDHFAAIRLPANAIDDPAWKDALDLQPGEHGHRRENPWRPLDWPDMWTIAHAAQADVYASHASPSPSGIATGIAVLHAVRLGVDPAADLTLVGTSPSGARLYRAKNGKDPTLELFVLPSSTWIFANGFAAARLEREVASGASEPPTLPMIPNSVVDATMPMDETMRVAAVREIGFLRHVDRVGSAGLVLYPFVAKRMPIAVKLLYPDAGEAREAADDLERLAADGSMKKISPESGPLDVATFGSALLLKGFLGGDEPSAHVERAPFRPPMNEAWSAAYDGEAAPDSTLTALDGKTTTSIAALRGKVVVVHFWGTWLIEAKRTLPRLEKMSERFAKDGLEVVGVTEDEDADAAARFAKDRGVAFRVVGDRDGNIKRSWSPETQPATFVVDRQGKVRATIRYLHRDPNVDDAAVEDAVRSLL